MKTVNDEELNTALVSVADTIRQKVGESSMYSFPIGFISAINRYTSYTGQSLSVMPQSTTIRLNPSSNFDAFSAIYVDGDADLIEENIKYGVTIFDVVGTGDGGIDKFATKSLTSFSSLESMIAPYTFSGFSLLSQIDMPLCEKIGTSAFYGCKTISELSFPVCTYIGYGAFDVCESLSSINIPSCTYIEGHAFQDCDLRSVDLPFCYFVGSSAFEYNYNLSYCSLPICTSIGKNAFNLCTKLEYIYVPECTSISDNTFYSCWRLADIHLPKCSYIPYTAFYRCYDLRTASIPALRIDGGGFDRCYNLVSLYLSGSSVCELHYYSSPYSFFYSTPIVGYTESTGGEYGTVYVPTSLYSDYISAPVWSEISSRIASYTF